MKIYQSSSSQETKKLAEKIAEKAAKRQATRDKRQGALVFTLKGELGSGKTTFIQGFLRGLGVKRRSASPTFIIFRKFQIPRLRRPARRQGRGFGGQANSEFQFVYHVDAYRIRKPRELLLLGLKDILADRRNVVLIEWADNIKKILPKSARWVKFSHGNKENKRKIEFKKAG